MNYRRLPYPTIWMQQAVWKHTPRDLPADVCWPWQGARTPGGYGLVSCQGTWSATRVVTYLTTWVDPYLLNVCHTCDNPPCVNPAHLVPATQQQNIWEAIERDRFHGRPRALSDWQTDLALALLEEGHRIIYLALALKVSSQTLSRSMRARAFA